MPRSDVITRPADLRGIDALADRGGDAADAVAPAPPAAARSWPRAAAGQHGSGCRRACKSQVQILPPLLVGRAMLAPVIAEPALMGWRHDCVKSLTVQACVEREGAQGVRDVDRECVGVGR